MSLNQNDLYQDQHVLIRIYMFDTVQEKGLAYRREDLKFLPTLNCTRWVVSFFTQYRNHRELIYSALISQTILGFLFRV